MCVYILRRKKDSGSRPGPDAVDEAAVMAALEKHFGHASFRSEDQRSNKSNKYSNKYSNKSIKSNKYY